MRGSLLMAVVAGLVASTPETAFSKPRSSPQPRAASSAPARPIGTGGRQRAGGRCAVSLAA